MDIISKTESTALKLKYGTENDTASMKLRKEILRDLKTAKSTENQPYQKPTKSIERAKVRQEHQDLPLRKRRGTCTNFEIQCNQKD